MNVNITARSCRTMEGDTEPDLKPRRALGHGDAASESLRQTLRLDADATVAVQPAPGLNFAAAVAAAGLNPSKVRLPRGSTAGGSQAGQAHRQHAGVPVAARAKWHPVAVRAALRLAYALDERTVMRGFLREDVPQHDRETPNGYSTGGGTIALSDAADAGWHRGLSSNFSDAISTFDRRSNART